MHLREIVVSNFTSNNTEKSGGQTAATILVPVKEDQGQTAGNILDHNNKHNDLLPDFTKPLMSRVEVHELKNRLINSLTPSLLDQLLDQDKFIPEDCGKLKPSTDEYTLKRTLMNELKQHKLKRTLMNEVKQHELKNRLINSLTPSLLDKLLQLNEKELTPELLGKFLDEAESEDKAASANLKTEGPVEAKFVQETPKDTIEV
jgi:hypothetical protein